MTERPAIGIGLMSGTSLDGIDAALVRFRSPTDAELLGFLTRPYADDERRQILDGIAQGGTTQLAHLHVRLAEWAADAVEALLAAEHVPANEIEFIAFPGQTIWHEPPQVTWQLGEPSVLAERFGVRVVSNLRARDVAAGGQGAPLVPMADVLLFASADHPRILLNIGGMANATYVPQRAEEHGVIAFDTGPGVAVLDAVAYLVDGRRRYDRDGKLAAQGTVRQEVLDELLADPFFTSPPPRSTGRERFGVEYARRLHERVPGADGVATAVALTAESIARSLAAYLPAAEVVASGGGVRHPGLMAALDAALARVWGGKASLRRFDDLFFSGDAKEAVAFALLGYLTLHGQPGSVASATGARGARVLGSITPA